MKVVAAPESFCSGSDHLWTGGTELDLQSDPVCVARMSIHVLRVLFQQEDWDGATGMLDPTGAGRDPALAPCPQARARTAH